MSRGCSNGFYFNAAFWLFMGDTLLNLERECLALFKALLTAVLVVVENITSSFSKTQRQTESIVCIQFQYQRTHYKKYIK